MVEGANRKEGGPLSVFSLTDQARSDLAEISDYLEDHADGETAMRLIESVHHACSLIADSPAIGRSLPDFGPGIRVRARLVPDLLSRLPSRRSRAASSA